MLQIVNKLQRCARYVQELAAILKIRSKPEYLITRSTSEIHGTISLNKLTDVEPKWSPRTSSKTSPNVFDPIAQPTVHHLLGKMEREVSDTEGIFSRRLSSNWAELPTTLRKKPKHRPEILSQFVDPSEISENESRKIEPRPFNNNVQRLVRRSEFLRKLDSNENGRNVDYRRETGRIERRSDYSLFPRVDEDYRKHYEDHDSKGIGGGPQRKKPEVGKFDQKNFSDEERKTNSPDSLLVKSSESDLSSDEYGQTDDSGAFLEKASNREKGSRSEGQRNRFIKFFAKDECKRKKKQEEQKKVSPLDTSNQLDVNKNNVKQISRIVDTKKERMLCQQKFEYENIPRIDVSKLDQKPYLNPIASTINSIVNSANSDRQTQPTIEQLRLEEGCLLRNSRNASPSGPLRIIINNNNNNSINNNNNNNNKNGVENVEKTSRAESPSSAKQCQNGEDVNELIQDFYDSDQIVGRVNGERKVSKMETITEENADGSKLSVREILKRFEELRTQNEAQVEEKSNDKTLTTIQETLKKLDEKVKSYQVTIPIKFLSSINKCNFVDLVEFLWG